MRIVPSLASCLIPAVIVAVGACAAPSQPPEQKSASSAPRSPSPKAPEAASVSPSAAQPAPPEAPPYDLVADLDARKEVVRDTVGKQARFETVEGVFLLAPATGVFGASAAVAKQAIAAYYHGRFDTRPTKAITVLLFDTAPPYEAYCKARWKKPCGTPYGFYAPADRTIVMNAGPGIGTLTHELVHPIVEADFPGAPTWIDEGIASLYEAFAFTKPGEIRGQKNWRHPALRAALLARGKSFAGGPPLYPSLPRLVGMSNTEFRGSKEGLNYATARYFCQWLESKGKLWAFYHAFRDGYAKDPTGEKAFVAVMGKSPAALDDEWAQWVISL